MIFFFRNIYDFSEKIAHLLSYIILLFINFFHFLLGKFFVSSSAFQGKWNKLQQYKKNNKVSILGNGPSLTNLKLEDLKNTDIITCNFFNRHPHSNKIKPNFHVIADGFEENASIDEIMSQASLSYLMHFSWKNNINMPHKVIFFFVPSILTIARWRSNKLDSSYNIPAPINSVQLALILSILLNYKKIYLYGVDEDQLSNRKIQENAHFYKEDKASAQGVSGIITSTYTERIKSKYLTMVAYNNLRDIANNYGIEIINKNSNSFVDSFNFK